MRSYSATSAHFHAPRRKNRQRQKATSHNSSQGYSSPENIEHLNSPVDEDSFATESPPAELRCDDIAPAEGDPVAPHTQGFVGHPDYLPNEYPTVGNPQEPPPISSSKEIDLEFLRLYDAFAVPPRPVRDSLFSNFTKYCMPWMPVVEPAELKTLGLSTTQSFQTGVPSLLLAQAIFVAGSRVQTTRFSFSSCRKFYSRAKALFFAEHEQNPLTLIRALCVLQWYCPSGPEFVSIHSSGFWLRTAVGLAFQIGLHKEPDPRREDYRLRRRLFWALFVSNFTQSRGDASHITNSLAIVSYPLLMGVHQPSIWTTVT